MSDITRFCTINGWRPWMNTPLRHGGFLYATDGNIAVRMPDDASVYAGDHDHGKAVIALFGKCEQAEYSWVAVPNVEDGKRCTHCGGSGKTSMCPDCDGEGQFDHGRHSYCCEECNGSGVVSAQLGEKTTVCEGCCGSGIHWHEGTDVAHAHYASRYLRLIAEQFPGAEIGVPQDETATAMWRCGDVVGLLMPLRRL